jgi:hypothetical protein
MKENTGLGTVANTCYPVTWEVELGGSWFEATWAKKLMRSYLKTSQVCGSCL